MKHLKAALLGLGLFLSAAGSAQAAKAMDCAECKENFGEGPACAPICTPPATGKKAIELYSAMQALGVGSCKGQACSADIKNVECQWSNSSDSRRAHCTYNGKDGKEETVEGAKARRLSKAMMAAGEVDISCGAGTCGFRLPQDADCAEMRKTQNRKINLSYECRVMPTVEEIPVPTKRPRPPGPARGGEKTEGGGTPAN